MIIFDVVILTEGAITWSNLVITWIIRPEAFIKKNCLYICEKQVQNGGTVTLQLI